MVLHMAYIVQVCGRIVYLWMSYTLPYPKECTPTNVCVCGYRMVESVPTRPSAISIRVIAVCVNNPPMTK